MGRSGALLRQVRVDAERRLTCLSGWQRTRLIILGYLGTLSTLRAVEQTTEVEFIFEPQGEGGYYTYAPDLPGLHTQGETLDEAIAHAEEALELYVEGLQESGRAIGAGVIRQRLRLPA